MSDEFEWDVGIATFSEKNADGFIGLQVDVYGEKDASAPPFEAFMPPGLYCRPRDPDTGPDGTPTLGANCLYAWRGNEGLAFPMHDPRVIAKLPNTIAPGDTVLYCDRGSDDSKVSLIALSAKDGAFTVSIPAKNGAGTGTQLRIDNENGFDFTFPYGRVKFGPTGIDISHNCGAKLRMGPVGGFPDPVGSIMQAANIASRATLQAGTVSVNAGLLSLGTDGGAANEIAVTALLTTLTTVVAALLEISTTPAAVGKPALTPATMAPVTAAFAALQPLIYAIGKQV